MYPNFRSDRKYLGYQVLKDTNCGIRLVFTVDSTVTKLFKPSKCKLQFAKNLSFKVNRKLKKVIFVTILGSKVWSSNFEPASAMGFSRPHIPVVRVQPRYRHLSELKIVPTVRLRLDEIIMMSNNHNKHMIPLNYLNVHHSSNNEQLLKKLRAGDLVSNLGLVAIGAIVYLIFQLSGVDAFEIIGQWNAPASTSNIGGPPPLGPTAELSSQPTSYKSSRFELQMADVNNNMCPRLAMPDENGFVMSYEEAYDLVAKTYPGYLEVDESYKITDWQAAKHMYHANGMGIDPTDYGFTQEQLYRIRGESRYEGGGIIAYARRGYRLPPIKMVRAYQRRLKASCNKAPIKRSKVSYYDSNGDWKSTVFATPPSEESSGIIIAFNESTKDLITGDKQRLAAFNRFESENYLGSKKWMLKWSNK